MYEGPRAYGYVLPVGGVGVRCWAESVTGGRGWPGTNTRGQSRQQLLKITT
jgi:hypothetical protein